MCSNSTSNPGIPRTLQTLTFPCCISWPSDKQGETASQSLHLLNISTTNHLLKLGEVLTGPCDEDWFSRLPPRCTRCILGNGNEGEGTIGGRTGVMTSSGSLLSCDTNAWKTCFLSISLRKESPHKGWGLLNDRPMEMCCWMDPWGGGDSD